MFEPKAVPEIAIAVPSVMPAPCVSREAGTKGGIFALAYLSERRYPTRQHPDVSSVAQESVESAQTDAFCEYRAPPGRSEFE